MDKKHLLTLDLDAILCYKWELNFTKEVFLPLQAKLKAADFWNKARPITKLYNITFGRHEDGFNKLPGNFNRKIPNHLEFKQDPLEALNNFFQANITVWEDGLALLTVLFKCYPSCNLIFGKLEFTFLEEIFNFLPCLDQLVFLLDVDYTKEVPRINLNFPLWSALRTAVGNYKFYNMLQFWIVSCPQYFNLFKDLDNPLFILNFFKIKFENLSNNTLITLMLRVFSISDCSLDDAMEELKFCYKRKNLFLTEYYKDKTLGGFLPPNTHEAPLKLTDIHFYNWKNNFQKDIYLPLHFKLRKASFFNKALQTTKNDKYMYSITRYKNDFNNIFMIYIDEPWRYDKDYKDYWDSFLGEALSFWSTQLFFLSILFKYYPLHGLTFGALEFSFIDEFFEILPCIDQLVILMDIKLEITDDIISQNSYYITVNIMSNKQNLAMLKAWLKSKDNYHACLGSINTDTTLIYGHVYSQLLKLNPHTIALLSNHFKPKNIYYDISEEEEKEAEIYKEHFLELFKKDCDLRNMKLEEINKSGEEKL